MNLKTRRQLKTKSNGVDSLGYRERPNPSCIQFCGRSGGLNVAPREPNQVTDLVVGCRPPVTICLLLVPGLCLFEVLLESAWTVGP